MLLLIDKPKGMTSHDVVNRVRRLFGERRVGHAGTLDPNATGLLIVAVGREFTKKLSDITKSTKKEYIADIFLGEERTTDDPEGEVVFKNHDLIPDREDVNKIIEKMVGEQSQTPPIYSAIKQQGKKSYELAREGKDVVMEPRKITVYEANIISYDYPLLVVSFTVSSGTYIRALARDIGKNLKTYAYLKDLQRTKIGQFSLENAHTLDDLPRIINK